MKDDPDFNINFVSLIEKHPCIYDSTAPEYNQKNVQDKAWRTIAVEVSASVEDCKERWKNLRACYTRHLKMLARASRFGAKAKKPYYLSVYLQFLKPFTKSRDLRDGISTPVTKAETEQDTAQIAASKPPEDISFRTPAPKKAKTFFLKAVPNYPVPAAPALECIEPRRIQRTETKTDDPDWAFLKSVLPDMKEMNNDQKRRFKIAVLNLAGEILNEQLANEYHPPPVTLILSTSSSSQTTTNSCLDS